MYVHTLPLSAQKANVVQVTSMCAALADSGFEVSLAVPESREQSGATQAAGYRVLTYPKLTVGGRLATLGSYAGARALIREHEPDLCLVRVPVLLRAAQGCGVPTVLELHNSKLHTRSRLLDRLWRRQLLRAVRSDAVPLVITISDALRDYWANEGIPREKMIALHDGFAADAFATRLDRAEARAKLGIDSDAKVVTYAGSLYADRGIETILDLAGLFPEVRFVVVGGPEQHRQLYSSRAAELGNVELVGWVEPHRVPDYLFAADVLLMIWSRSVPTINYCSPLKMFEYMAAGRVIVGHGFPTIREVLRDGETALLADPDDFEALAAKLRQALTSPHGPEIAERARQLAFDEYTWRARAERISAEVLRRLEHRDKWIPGCS